MYPHSSAAEAIIRAFRSIKPRASNMPAHVNLAETWVQASLTAGCQPHMRQEPLKNYDVAGEWVVAVSKAAVKNPLYPGRLPDYLHDEVFYNLASLGLVLHDNTLRVWHGNVWPEDSSARALALRIRLVRQSLKKDLRRFYGDCGVNPKGGSALEAAHTSFAALHNEMLHDLAAYYGIPDEWLTFGYAEELQPLAELRK